MCIKVFFLFTKITFLTYKSTIVETNERRNFEEVGGVQSLLFKVVGRPETEVRSEDHVACGWWLMAKLLLSLLS
jgi:hypothetical protein